MADIKYIIPFTKGWEGGLSNDKNDRASENPSPYEHKGQMGWHTNKGVTYAAFKSNAPKLGYQDTASNFLVMPDDVWLKIAKQKYWDVVGLDSVKSQAVANVMFSWQWGSGYAWVPRVSKYLNSKGIKWNGGKWVGSTIKLDPDFKQITSNLNLLIDKQGEKQTFDDLANQKKEFLLSLKGTKANPVTDKYPQGVYTNGWMNRLKDLQTYSYTLFGKTITDIGAGLQNNSGKIVMFFFALSIVAGGIVLYKNAKG